eukprot:5108974-Pyramimonas_sp.AAC.1
MGGALAVPQSPLWAFDDYTVTYTLHPNVGALLPAASRGSAVHARPAAEENLRAFARASHSDNPCCAPAGPCD